MPRPIAKLEALSRRFGPRLAASRIRALRRALTLPLEDSRCIALLHDTLLFMTAFPASSDEARLTHTALTRLAARLQEAQRRRERRLCRRLADSGIAHTTVTHAYTLFMTAWLVDRFGRDVELTWDDDHATPDMMGCLELLAAVTERDGLLAPHLSYTDWMALARQRGATALSWVTNRVLQLEGDAALREALFERFGFEQVWRLRSRAASRTFVRFPARRTTYQKTALHSAVDLPAVAREALPAHRPLRRAAARSLLDACRATLCVRHRETDMLTYATESEVFLVRLHGGIDVAVFGMTPERRLPIESSFGYVVARNRVPLGYGGAWALGRHGDIGVNIFPEFRGGESAWVFAQVVRVFHHLLGVDRFQVDGEQFGDGNPEAIRSGAFWFYYRLGFRPVDPQLRALADRENAHCRTDRAYRVSAPTLRRLAGSPMAITLRERSAAPRINLPAVGVAVTRWIATRFAGDRVAARTWAERRALRLLHVGSRDTWTAAERRAFADLSLLVGVLPEVAQWPAAQRTALGRLFRAKGAVRERPYVRRVQGHPRWLSALAQVGQAGAAM